MAPSLAQIQEWDLSPPQPIATDRHQNSTPVSQGRRSSLRPPLQPIQHRARRLAQGQAVAFGGAERGLGGEGLHLQALAGEGAAGAGAGVAGDAAGGNTELDEAFGGGTGVTRHIGRQRGVAAELGGSQPLSRAGGGQVRQSIKCEEWPSRRSTAEGEDRSSRCVPEV